MTCGRLKKKRQEIERGDEYRGGEGEKKKAQRLGERKGKHSRKGKVGREREGDDK